MMTDTKEKNIILIGAAFIAIVIFIMISRALFFDDTRTEKNDTSTLLPAPYREITATELKEKRDAGEKIRLIDLRAPEIYAQEHIIDSVNIPAQQIAQNGIPVSNDTTTIILIGDDTISATDFPVIMSRFTDEQKKNTVVFTGGFSFWKTNGGETISSGDPTSFTDQAKIIGITAETLRDMLTQTPRDFLLLDVRAENVFANGHLPGAINIPFSQLESRRTHIPVGKRLIVYGATELDGFRGGVALHDLHFYATSVLYGGFTSWQQKNFPVEK